MASAPSITETFGGFLQQELQKDLLRFTTAGSVDDGKSTLIGRLLHDAKGVYEDQLASVKKSKVNRSTGLIDFSLLTDGLRAEREQGITIDVAYRYFATARRRFIIADTPGHEQYTRNMATGASTADLAVILIDATKGLLPQTRRHSFIASLLGIPNVVAAVNKMDLVGYNEAVYRRLREDFLALAAQLKVRAAECVPVCAVEGDNVVDVSVNMPWYHGPTLLEHLETVPVGLATNFAAMRFPVQYVIRPDATFRGFAGQIAEGEIRAGDQVLALPSGQTTRVRSIVTFDGKLGAAERGQSITVELEDEIDISRGEMLVSPRARPQISNVFEAALVWMNETPLEVGRTYLAKHTTRQVKARVTAIRNRIDVNTLAHQPARDLQMNGIAVVEVETSNPLFFDPYEQSRVTGGFILIDALSNATVAAGMIRRDLSQPAANRISPEPQAALALQNRVMPREKFERHGHQPAVLVLASALLSSAERALFDAGFETIALDAGRISSASFTAVLDSLRSAGFIVLLAAEHLAPVTPAALAAQATEAFFHYPESPKSEREQIAQVISDVQTLRLAARRSDPKAN
ncbi:MAG TPA: sulfate adenylyltransferase subunit CysN [Candidatus Dormibacteraeota bacterium]|nr:sulfate adenylyltransferase subunit CysN [Candidatus Dormibacteraeota bacterium]